MATVAVRNRMLIFFAKLVGVFQASLHFGFMLMAVFILARHAHYDFNHHGHDKHHEHREEDKSMVNIHEQAVPSNLQPMPMMHIIRMQSALSGSGEGKAKHHQQHQVVHTSTPIHIFWMRVFRIPIEQHTASGEIAQKVIDPPTDSEANKFDLKQIDPKLLFERARNIFKKQAKVMRQHQAEMLQMNPFMINQALTGQANKLISKRGEEVGHHGHHHHHHPPAPQGGLFNWHHKYFKCSRHMGLFTIVASSPLFLVAILMIQGIVKQRPCLMMPFIMIHFACLTYSIIMFLTHLSYLPYIKFWIARMHHHLPLKRALLAMDTRLLSALILFGCIGYLLVKASVCLAVYLCFRHLVLLNRINAMTTAAISVTVIHAKPQSDDKEIDELKAQLKQKEAEESGANMDVGMLKLPLYSETEGIDNNGMEKEDEAKLIV
jgi:hypothetical protein